MRQLTGLPESPPGIDPRQVAALPSRYRWLGWRLIGREAYYLHLVGRTPEARRLLAEAIDLALERGQPNVRPENTYITQLFNQLGLLESFVGYKERALKLYRQERDLIAKAGPSRRASWLIARINLIQTEADISGVTEALIQRGQAVVEEAKQLDPNLGLRIEQALVELKLQLRNRQETIERLDDLSRKQREREDLVAAFYASRAVLFARSETGESGLDGEFNRLLAEVRQKGEKRAEPRLYRRYGDWLARQGRYGEALSVYREALRMSRQFEWHPQVPRIQAKIGAVLLVAGQPDKAKEMWQRMDRYIAEHPDLPASAILTAWEEQMLALVKAERADEAFRVAQRAREFGASTSAPEPWLLPFRKELLASYNARTERESDAPPVPAEPALSRPVFFQPLGLTTVTLVDAPAVASFYLINYQARAVTGQLTVKGAGIVPAEKPQADRPLFFGDPAQPETTAVVAIDLPPGGLLEVPLQLHPSPVLAEALTVHLTWAPEGGAPVHAEWSVSWGEKPTESVVLDAARLGLSPFLGVPVLHHLGFPSSDAAPQPFRLRSPVPLRIEYRDANTHDLIAVDNNGNGDFAEAGDFCLPSAAGDQRPLAPRIAPEKETSLGRVEVWFYPRAEHP